MRRVPIDTLYQIKDALHEGKGIQCVADECGVGRMVVRKVRDGKINVREVRRRRREVQLEDMYTQLYRWNSRKHTKCSTCGGMVQEPCLLCYPQERAIWLP